MLHDQGMGRWICLSIRLSFICPEMTSYSLLIFDSRLVLTKCKATAVFPGDTIYIMFNLKMILDIF